MSAIGKMPLGLATRSGAEDGFTLIEALVTLAVGALIAGIAFPSVERALGSWRFSQAETDVRIAIEQARATALRRGEAVTFAARPDGRSFAVGAGAVTDLPDGIRFERAPVTLIFYADGSAQGGRVRLVGARRARMFNVTSDTGLLDVTT